MGAVYYNEFDKNAAQWLRNLIAAGHLPAGDVDERSIEEVKADDVKGYDQCHFFAGIGGWPLALRIAEITTTRSIWTGSCPCQPFSVIGKRAGTDDERHLWPEFYRLIRECNPSTVFGEQVASADGRIWFDGVRTDMEAMGYAVGGGDLCAAGIGAPHIRQRIYWVGYTERARSQGYAGNVDHSDEPGRINQGEAGSIAEASRHSWGDFWVHCADGKSRRIQSSVSPLAHGVSSRVVRIRGYGNAIVPQLAAEFIRAADEALII